MFPTEELGSEQGGTAYNRLYQKNFSGGWARDQRHLFQAAHTGDLFQNSGYSDEFRFYYCGFRELRV